MKGVSMGRFQGVNKKKTKSRGVGDTLEKIIHKATLGAVKPCEGCKKRKAALNKAFPYAPTRERTGGCSSCKNKKK